MARRTILVCDNCGLDMKPDEGFVGTGAGPFFKMFGKENRKDRIDICYNCVDGKMPYGAEKSPVMVTGDMVIEYSISLHEQHDAALKELEGLKKRLKNETDELHRIRKIAAEAYGDRTDKVMEKALVKITGGGR
jgi:hypothetical protein